jgi:RNA polymerase sigma factor (sigma-70 family)
MRRKPDLGEQELRTLQLWPAFCRGDKEAFAGLYQQYAAALLSYGNRVSENQNAVKDAMQDLFVEIWKSRENLQDVVDVKSYLFKSLRYKLIRQSRLRIVYTTNERFDDLLKNEDSVETAILKRESKTELAEKMSVAIQALSPRQQEAVSLKYYHGFTNEQIALIMAVNYQSATNILHRAILLLRKNFKSSLVTLLQVIFCFQHFL